MIPMFLLPHSVVHALFDPKWSLLKPIQKMLCTFTLLSRHILEPSYRDLLMFKPSHLERRHNNRRQLGNSCPTSEGVAFLAWVSNHSSKAPEQKPGFLLSEISMKPVRAIKKKDSTTGVTTFRKKCFNNHVMVFIVKNTD